MSLVVEFAVSDPGDCPVAQASAAAESTATEVARASRTEAGPVTEEFALPADVDAAVGEFADVERVGTAGSDAVYRFERDGASPCVCESVESVAGPATDVRAENGTLVVTARVDDREAVRVVVDRLREAFGGVRVRRLTELSASDASEPSRADDSLTERQTEVLRTAYAMGYFEYPKGANAGDVADALGISRSTLAEHLAAAQGKLLASLFDTEELLTEQAASDRPGARRTT